MKHSQSMILQSEMIDVEIISTGSKGNAVFLDGQVLIDCGVPFSKLVECEVVDRVKYIFLTHQHGDHCNVATLKRLLSEHPCIRIIYPNYLCKKLFLLGDTSFQYNSFIVAQDKWYSISNITFSAVPLRHDVPNIGWKLHFNTQQGIYKVIYATDTSEIAHITAKNYDLYLVEANYSKTELLNRIKDKRLKGQYVYEDRVLRTHLSKEKCDEWLYQNMGNNSFFVYMHQHEDLV